MRQQRPANDVHRGAWNDAKFSPFMAAHVGTVISSTARHNVPAIFEATLFASKGGLIAYGASFTDMFRRAAAYVDRILRGEFRSFFGGGTPAFPLN